MKVSTKVSNCASCGAIVNPRWGECLSCGMMVLDGQALPVEQVAPAAPERPTENPPKPTPTPSAGPPADRLGTVWGHEVGKLVCWFRTATPPAEPFELMPGVTIAAPVRWWASIAADIDSGPRRARGKQEHSQAT